MVLPVSWDVCVVDNVLVVAGPGVVVLDVEGVETEAIGVLNVGVVVLDVSVD